MLNMRMSARQKKQLMLLCLIMLLMWIVLIGIVISITAKPTTFQTMPVGQEKIISQPVLQNPLVAPYKNMIAEKAEKVGVIEPSQNIIANEEDRQKFHQAVKNISDLVGKDGDYDSDSEAVTQAQEALSALIRKNPQLSQTLIEQILQDPHSNISAEMIYTLGESQSPMLEKIISEHLASATDQEKIHLFSITQFWANGSPLVIDSVLQSLQMATSSNAQISALETLQYNEAISAEAKQTAANVISSIVDSNANTEVLSVALRTLGQIATAPEDLQKPLEALNSKNTDLQSAALDAFSDTSITSDEIKEKLVSYAADQEDCVLYEQAITSLNNYTLTADEKKLANVRVGECELSSPVSANF